MGIAIESSILLIDIIDEIYFIHMMIRFLIFLIYLKIERYEDTLKKCLNCKGQKLMIDVPKKGMLVKKPTWLQIECLYYGVAR